MNLPPELLAILVCPQCKGDIEPRDEESCLACGACRLKYPVIDGNPLMLIEEAVPVDEA